MSDVSAGEFLSGNYRAVLEFDVTLTRKSILYCRFTAEEPDFIRDVGEHPTYLKDARRVIGRMAPHVVELAGRAATGWRATAWPSTMTHQGRVAPGIGQWPPLHYPRQVGRG